MMARYPKMGAGGGFWSGPQKLVELSACRHLVEELQRDGVRVVRDVQPRQETSPATPPDCLAIDEQGGWIGMEATELVKSEVIPGNIKAARALIEGLRGARNADDRFKVFVSSSAMYWDWTASEITQRLGEIIAEKDRKWFQEDAGRPYVERWLVVHTDDIGIPPGEFDDEVRDHDFGVVHQFNRVFLLWGYCPHRMGHPWLELSVALEPRLDSR